MRGDAPPYLKASASSTMPACLRVSVVRDRVKIAATLCVQQFAGGSRDVGGSAGEAAALREVGLATAAAAEAIDQVADDMVGVDARVGRSCGDNERRRR